MKLGRCPDSAEEDDDNRPRPGAPRRASPRTRAGGRCCSKRRTHRNGTRISAASARRTTRSTGRRHGWTDSAAATPTRPRSARAAFVRRREPSRAELRSDGAPAGPGRSERPLPVPCARAGACACGVTGQGRRARTPDGRRWSSFHGRVKPSTILKSVVAQVSVVQFPHPPHSRGFPHDRARMGHGALLLCPHGYRSFHQERPLALRK